MVRSRISCFKGVWFLCGSSLLLLGMYQTFVFGGSAPRREDRPDYFLFRVGMTGDLKKGVAWSNPRFKDNGNGAVTDNLPN